MPTIEDLKELETPATPIFIFDCTLSSGDVYRWCTHAVTVNGNVYAARVLKHNVFEMRSLSDDATDGVAKISITLANADSFFSPVERTIGWKGAQLTVQFLFYDFVNQVAATNAQVSFRGVANPPDQSTESYLKLSFTNRLSLTRVYLPETRIQKRCPWTFPSTAAQMTEAVNGGSLGQFSPFYPCGYSAGLPNGVGNLNNGQPYTSCDYTRGTCQTLGMFNRDSSGNQTRRFGALEFVPSSILVRGYGERGSHVSLTDDNQALYNDFIPLVYGTGWYFPPITFARNDGNLTHVEVLLGAGPLTAIVTVVVNGVQIPEGVAGKNMNATGWYNVVTLGGRTGAFNLDFVDSKGNPLGDPYGSLGCLSVVVPNIISNGSTLPEIQVLVQGLQVSRYDTAGALVDTTFSNNPVWVLLDILRRSGWTLSDVDLSSFATAGAVCDQPVTALDLNGNPANIPRFQCNLFLTKRRSAADVVRGIRTGANLYLTYGQSGLLQARVEDTLANQQPALPAGSNSTEPLYGGWPAYEFGDNAFSGILRGKNGQASFSTRSKSSADSPNLYTVEFQDEFNEYQQDSLTLVDTGDSLLSGHEITASVTALGLPNFDQATRVTSLQLNKSVNGNTFVDFETSVKGVDLRPGDLITITYSKEGFDRQPFRIISISPTTNYRTMSITAQIHDDEWYTASGGNGSGTGRQPGVDIGLPRPLVGTAVDSSGDPQFGVAETTVESTDGSVTVELSVAFVTPVSTMPASSGIPLLGLNAQISIVGGTLSGGQTLYYGVTALDALGAESALSFLVKAAIPGGTNTNQVTLPSLSFPSTAASFNAYRGPNQAQLLQIASAVPISTSFTDSGAPANQVTPPDVNYDHANFYWRIELQPEANVNIQSTLTIGNNTLQMLPNDYSGSTVRITQGTGLGQERTISGNTATTITVTSPWDVVPDATSSFVVSESSWQFGATSSTSPVVFDVPNREGTVVQISGRSANVLNQECSYALCPLTRWSILGSGGSELDTDVPPVPTFGLSPIGGGTVQVVSIGFTTIDNTRSVTAGTLTLGYWDEINSLPSLSLAADLDGVTTTLSLNNATGAATGDLIQVESEVMVVQEDAKAANTLTVARGAYGTAAGAHATGSSIFQLQKTIYVMPFPRDFFGSLASGDYSYPIYLPDVRIATAELFATNSQGNSDVARMAFTTGSADMGLRTLSGGQLSLQVQGMLAIQTNAVPAITMDATHSVNYVTAVVGVASTGTDIELEVTQGGNTYCALTIPAGSTSSNSVDGFALGPLASGSTIGLNITSVSQTTDTLPGSDLTVTITF